MAKDQKATDGTDWSKSIGWLVFSAVVLGPLASGIGALVGSRLEIGRWREQVNYSAKQDLVRKRIELADRTVRLSATIAKGGLFKAMSKHATSEALGLQKKGEATLPALETGVATTERLFELEAELGAVLSLDAIYFGPETKQAVNRFMRALDNRPADWWNAADKAMFKQLIDAIENELIADLPSDEGKVTGGK